MPRKNLVPGGYLYFHHYVWLNAYLFIADYNIVNISDETDAVLAKYGDADARCYLLMVDYPDATAATAAREKLKSEFAPESAGEHPKLRLEDGTWFTAWTRANRLCAIFDGRSLEQIDNLYHLIK